ncbi:glutaredoxin family protein [Candidatus Parcubacteria bacterium]|nr:glutaredoxin family protein [Candidatus Parcubacteria bacterium]
MKRRHTVVIYTSGSQFCGLAKDYFKTAGVDYEEIRVNNDPLILDKLRQKTGGTTMPVVEIDGRPVAGFRPDMYEILLGRGNEKTEEKT